jgi:CRISPR/Cas system CSM-associated protein Csm2 small subunit
MLATAGKEDRSEHFYEELKKALDKINESDYLLVA